MLSSDIQEQMDLIRAGKSGLTHIPKSSPLFEEYGHCVHYRTILESNKFFPFGLYGLPGVGKSFTLMQLCARLQQECIRVHITEETDESDLFGGFRLLKGDTVWEWGPVPIAMMRGCKLVMDEFDLATPKISCMHAVLEGEPILIKKLGIIVEPTEGFNIITTSNTMGRGDLTGRFVGVHTQNEAFLDRIATMFEHDYPDPKTEHKILVNRFRHEGYRLTSEANRFFKNLTKWAEGIRAAYRNGADGEAAGIITTRRLMHIVRAYGLFKDFKDGDSLSIEMGVAGFEPNTVSAFLELYNRIQPANVVNEPGNDDAIDVTDPPENFD